MKFKVGDKLKIKDTSWFPLGTLQNSMQSLGVELTVLAADDFSEEVKCDSELSVSWFLYDEVVLVEDDAVYAWCILEENGGFVTGVFKATQKEANVRLHAVEKRENSTYSLYKMTKSRTERKVVEEKLIVEEF